MKTLIQLTIVVLLLLASAQSFAAVPMLLNYQGNVVDGTGMPVDGTGFFKFAIVNQAGDTAYWVSNGATMDGSEPPNGVSIPVSNGAFSLKLGDTNLTNMAALTQTVFDNSVIYLRVWFSTNNINFEQFASDIQILSTGFAFKAAVADTVLDSAVNSTTIQDNSISNIDISGSAAISASKIDTVGLDADTLDGLNSTDLAQAAHTHGDADITDVGWNKITGMPAGFADGIDNDTNTTYTAGSGISLVGTAFSTNDTVVARKDATSGNQTFDSGTLFLDYTNNRIGVNTTSPTQALEVIGDIAADNFTYRTPQTEYLMLAGAGCAHPPGAAIGIQLYQFYCDLSDGTSTSPVYWSVNIPNGAVITGMLIRAYTGTGTTTCTLNYGTNGSGTTIATVTDASAQPWHTTTETAVSHSADTATYAYAVTCSNPSPGDNVIGYVRIKFTTAGP